MRHFYNRLEQRRDILEWVCGKVLQLDGAMKVWGLISLDELRL